MKKLLSILLLFLSVKGVCQFPVNSTNGTATTTNLTRGIAAADSGFQYRSYFLDTASANRGRIDEVPGVMIRTAPNVIWLRNSTATAWIRQANINDIINITGCYTLLNGGIVTWSGTGLTMDVTLANYIIGCRFFTSPVSQVTLAAADVTNPRIDVIAVDTNSAVVVITGTPAANPVKPQVNTSSQLELTQILVPANATTPGGITQTIVYDENEGTPDEWDATFQAVNGTVNFASTSIPFHLTIDAVPSTDAEGLMLFTAAAPVSMTDYSVVKLYIYNGSSYGQADDIQISLYRSGNPVTGALSAESYGYSHAVSGSYQIVTIPMSVFIAGATDDLNQFDAIGIRIYESNSVNNLHFDYIQLQGGIPTGNSPYITNIFRIQGVDSFYFTRNGINYPIKDSIGSGGGSSYTFPYSVVAPGNAIQLENDTTANPANYFYGRNSAGRRGWYPQSGIAGVNIFNSDGTLTGNRTIDASNYNLKAYNIQTFDFVSKPTYYTSTSRIRAFGAFDDAVGGGIMLSSTDEEGTDSSYIHVQEQNITINSRGGNLYIPNLNYTLSTTAKKIPIIDTASGYTYWIDPALIGGGGSSLFPVTGTGTATGNVTGSLATNQLNITNNRGYLKFRNADSAMLHIKGSGSLPLFQLDSNGAVRFKVYAGGQIAAGDSAANLFIGQNSGLNIQPGDINTPPGNWNYSLGTNTLQELTVGNDNVAIGSNSMRYSLSSFHSINIGTGTSGNATHIEDVVAIGTDNLIAVDSSSRLTAIGSYSQFKAERTIGNTSTGFASQYGGATGPYTGSYNTSNGYESLRNITTSGSNFAGGYQSLYTQSTGNNWGGNNTAVGSLSGYSTNNDYGLFLGNSAGFYSNEANAFYLHTLTSGISNETDGKNYSMFYGKFASAGANQLRMNGRFGINTMPDASAALDVTSTTSGLLVPRMTTTQRNAISSPAVGLMVYNTTDSAFNYYRLSGWTALGAGGGGGGSLTIGDAITSGTANRILFENGSNNLAEDANLTWDGTTLKVQDVLTVGRPTVTTAVGTLNIAAKDAEGKLAFKYDGTDFGYFKVNTASGQVSFGSDQYPVSINSGSTTTINSDLKLNTTTLGLGRKLDLTYTGVSYGYLAIETANSEFRSVSPNTYDFTWRTASTELMRLKEATGRLGIGTSSPDSKLHVVGSIKMVDGNQAANKVMTSDANGVGSWQALNTESTYTPTLTNTTNVAASTAYTTYYQRIGDVVRVWGEISIDATTSLTVTELGISLPIATAIGNTYELAGNGSYEDNTTVQIKGDVTNDRAMLRFYPQTDTNNTYSFSFTYKYIAP